MCDMKFIFTETPTEAHVLDFPKKKKTIFD